MDTKYGHHCTITLRLIVLEYNVSKLAGMVIGHILVPVIYEVHIPYWSLATFLFLVIYEVYMPYLYICVVKGGSIFLFS